ncbi:hypothetical protein JWG44_03680 [Leptospira sp. 201903071]|nr:hypothetical protein [Leptospira ainazelensis]MBM9499346.1 hypothetical protein [Leptospira ainazelensis]
MKGSKKETNKIAKAGRKKGSSDKKIPTAKVLSSSTNGVAVEMTSK